MPVTVGRYTLATADCGAADAMMLTTVRAVDTPFDSHAKPRWDTADGGTRSSYGMMLLIHATYMYGTHAPGSGDRQHIDHAKGCTIDQEVTPLAVALQNPQLHYSRLCYRSWHTTPKDWAQARLAPAPHLPQADPALAAQQGLPHAAASRPYGDSLCCSVISEPAD